MERVPRHFVRRERYARCRKNDEVDSVNRCHAGSIIESEPAYRNDVNVNSANCFRESRIQTNWRVIKNVTTGTCTEIHDNAKERPGDKAKPMIWKLHMNSNRSDRNIKQNCNRPLSRKLPIFEVKDYHQPKNTATTSTNTNSTNNSLLNNIIRVNETTGNEVQNIVVSSPVYSEASGITSGNTSGNASGNASGPTSVNVSVQCSAEKIPQAATSTTTNSDVDEALPGGIENFAVNKRALKKPRKWCGTVRNRNLHANSITNDQKTNKLQNINNSDNNNINNNNNNQINGQCDVITTEIQKKTGDEVCEKQPEMKSVGTSSTLSNVNIKFSCVDKKIFQCNLFSSLNDTSLVFGNNGQPILQTLQGTFDLRDLETLKANIMETLERLPKPNDSCVNQRSEGKDLAACGGGSLSIAEVVETETLDNIKNQDTIKENENDNDKDDKHRSDNMKKKVIEDDQPKSQRKPKIFKANQLQNPNLILERNGTDRRKPHLTSSKEPTEVGSFVESNPMDLLPIYEPLLLDDHDSIEIVSMVIKKFNKGFIKQIVLLFHYTGIFLQRHGKHFLFFVVLPLFYVGILFFAYCSCRAACEQSGLQLFA